MINTEYTSTPEASLNLALSLAQTYGFCVIPCGEILKGRKKGQLKRPIVRNGGWQRKASRSPADIVRMWEQRTDEQSPIAVGIACGNSGIWVLDVDKEHAETVKDQETGEQVPTGKVYHGLEELAALEAQYGKLPNTFTVRTGTGGLHYYFKQPAEGVPFTNSTGRLKELAPAFDVRGTGGQVIAPGNVYELNGTIRRYDLIDPTAPVEAPEWLVSLIRDKAPVQSIYPAQTQAQAQEKTKKLDPDMPRLYTDENGDTIFNIDLSDVKPLYADPLDYSDPATRQALKEVRAEAAEYINNHPERILQPDKSGKGFVCPLCGSGSGRNGTGMTVLTTDKNGRPCAPHFTCWNQKCREKNGIVNSSILNIIGKMNSIPADSHSFPVLIDKACEIYGLNVKEEAKKRRDQTSAALEARLAQCAASQPVQATATAPAAAQGTPAQTNLQAQTSRPAAKQATEKEPEIDYTEYFAECSARLDETNYTRGISRETLKAYNVGYDPNWKSSKAPASAPATPRLIIPTSKYSYLARDTRKADQIMATKTNGYTKQKEGKLHLFNAAVLEGDLPVFVAEGELDALSLIDLGFSALALGSTTNADIFFRAIDRLFAEGRDIPPLVLALDNDDAGKGAQEVLKKGLNGRALAFTEMEIPGGKDPNEALIINRQMLSNAGNEAVIRACAEAEALKERLKEELRSQCAGRALEKFLEDTRNKEAVYYPTGIRDLDLLLDGGLYAGLYIIGAISSLGKTTFTLSIADYIAQHGQDVLIFSLEMARNELIAKSVSRITGRICIGGEIYAPSTAYAQTTRSVLGKRTALYTEEEKAVLDAAFDEYRRIGEHIYISEGMGNIGVGEIREAVQRHTRIMGKPPVVFIDYLQILAPYDPKCTDKQNTDKAVLELKRISRDFCTPVFAISSFNRDNYAQSVSMVAFKESGAIEYSSDVLLGMQYNGMDAPDGMLKSFGKPVSKNSVDNVRFLSRLWQERASQGNEIEIQVKVLKNRNGRRGSLIQKFWPKYNYFEDLPVTEAEYRRKLYEKLQMQRAEEQAERRRKKEAQPEPAEDNATPAPAQLSFPDVPEVLF